MFRAYTRLALLFAAIILGLVYQLQGNAQFAIYLYLAAALLLASHLLFGNIWQAFTALRSGRPGLADHILGLVVRPTWLLPRPRAYYHFVQGMLALRTEQLEEGDRALQRALAGPLRSDRDRALALLNRAHIAYLQQNWSACRALKEEAEQLQARDLLIQEHLKKLNQALNQQGDARLN
jgi:hypothetical protein